VLVGGGIWLGQLEHALAPMAMVAGLLPFALLLSVLLVWVHLRSISVERALQANQKERSRL